MEKNNVIQVIDPQMEKRIETEREGLKFTKNFRSATAEEWYVFLPGFKDPKEKILIRQSINHPLKYKKDKQYRTYITYQLLSSCSIIFIKLHN